MTDAPPRRTPPRLLQVKRTERLSASLKRVVLGGPALAGFPRHSHGAHIKLMFPQPHQRAPVLPTINHEGAIQWPPNDQRPIVRTYSVGGYDAEQGELAVDMVLHGDNGPASHWAEHAQPGDAIGLAGPGGPERVAPDADWYLLLADLSSFAALNCALNSLPANAQGHAFIEVAHEQDITPLNHPTHINVTWLIRHGAPARHSTLLLDAVRTLAWPAGQPSVMVAGESTQVVAIRDYVLREKHLPKSMLYAVPYWKETLDEESYHAERHRIMDELDA